MDDLTPRLRSVCDLDVAEMREYSGRHEYDGRVQDLSPDGVRAGLARLAQAAADGPPLDDPHDEAHLAAFAGRGPGLPRRPGDAPAQPDPAPGQPGPGLLRPGLRPGRRSGTQARSRHLAAWPEAIDAALESLDQLSAPVADALADGIRGLAAGIPADADEPVRRGRARRARAAGGAHRAGRRRWATRTPRSARPR